MSNSNPLNPYFTFRTRGSKSHLLLPANGLVLPTATDAGGVETHSACGPLYTEFDRRRLLKYGCVGAATVGAFTFDTEEAEAGFFSCFFGLIAVTAFTAAITWVVERVLDKKFGYTERQLQPVETRKPRPTTDDFHNRFADPMKITNTAEHIGVEKRRDWGIEFGMKEHLQKIDNNTKEVEAIGREVKDEDFGGPEMVAKYPRRKVGNADARIIKRVSNAYDLDFDFNDVHYLAGQTTKKRKNHSILCVQKGSKKHLLIDSAT